MGKMIELTASDGFKLGAYLAEPAGKPRGAVVVMQEIFGVNSHIKSVADGYAADGYLAIAPAEFDRGERNYEAGYTQPEIQAGVAVMQKLSWDNTMLDVQAAVDYVKHAGKVGIVGYCRGGTVTFLASAKVTGLSAAVSYYAGFVQNFIAEKPKCALMFHFGELDQNPSPEIGKQMLAANPAATGHFYPGANHGFNCDQRPSYHAESAKLARERSLAFFRQHLG